jgi:hypothetical protein
MPPRIQFFFHSKFAAYNSVCIIETENIYMHEKMKMFGMKSATYIRCLPDDWIANMSVVGRKTIPTDSSFFNYMKHGHTRMGRGGLGGP